MMFDQKNNALLVGPSAWHNFERNVMREMRWYDALSKVSWPGYRGKVLLCVVFGSVTPAATGLILFADAPPTLLTGWALATLCLAALATFAVAELLRPVTLAADALRDVTRLDRAAALPRSYTDDAGLLMAGIAEIASKVSNLQHRWVQRHPLTGLPTRELLLIEMAEDLSADPGDMLLGTIRFADYDRLATFDASSAEGALKAFAERLTAATGSKRPVAHVDRDCFAIWFCNAANAQNAAVELQAICYALGAEISAGDLKLVPDLEVGAAVYPKDGSEPGALVTRALVSLAKIGQSATAPIDLTRNATRAREMFALEQDLRHAIDREQLQLHFQPVFDLAKRRLVGAEALLRWHHPRSGMISPARFVPILEETGMTHAVGLWTLNAACREARHWQRQGLEGLKIAVNLSATQLHDPELKQMITRTLERHQLQPQALELELTETAATEDAERTFALFGELRAMGISLAIDDFGSGYSSLSYVKNLPFDKLKIDREFVVKVHERRDSQAICRSLIELARGLGIKLLAEGVESEDEVRLLRGFGCTLFQGYYFSRPLVGDEFVRRALGAEWPHLSPVNARITDTRMSA
jgi:EAL domain-containing protein (putative c-di-GMP-specific phosphodiesterase class I)/GGDEF domain-containing protein